jgi:metal-sulfur cluster biosynthetic enzyme
VSGENGEDVTVTMTLTSPACPVGPQFKQSVEDKVKSLAGVRSVNVQITFDPPWDPRIHASEDAKFDLGIWF